MNHFLALIFIAGQLLFPVTISAEDTLEWKEQKSDHFIVYFTGDENFAKDVLGKSEIYYRQIAGELGYERYSDFWTWDKRAKIYIYPDHASFLKATGQPEWAYGMADYRNKKIVSFSWSSGFLEELLPHEMAHLIFRDFVGFKGEVPLWLDEGVAQYCEEFKKTSVKEIARATFEEDGFLSLEDMMKLDVRNIKTGERIYIRSTRTREGEPTVLFLSGEKLVNTYYIQAASLVGFLIERYGSQRFIDFCRQLRDGKSIDESLRFTYSGSIENLRSFEDRWREYLEQTQPKGES